MRILLATDGSKDARVATAYLKELRLPAATTVRIIVAVTLPGFALDEPPMRELKRSVFEQARGLADEARAALAPCDLAVETDVVVGDPRAEILRAADEWRADLIVLGARGLGRIKRWLLGSVSLAVTRRVPSWSSRAGRGSSGACSSRWTARTTRSRPYGFCRPSRCRGGRSFACSAWSSGSRIRRQRPA